MSAKHTPGPWEVETPMGRSAPWIVQANLQSYEWEPIATLGNCVDDDLPPQSKAQKLIEANARLIASAPELLEALEAACNAIFNAGLVGEATDAYLSGRRVLARARGAA